MEGLSGFIQNISQNYGHFFSWGEISAALADPVNWGIIGSLVLLEGLLSADNALVLAVMVRHLPKEQQKKALFYGILGAYLFRFLAIGLGVYLIQFTLVKVLGALYLGYLAYNGLFRNKDKGEPEEGKEFKGASFWKTVLMVELMDIAFSIDSVIAAFGMSNEVWVLFLGGILGVLMMRGVAQLFLGLIAKFPELEQTAFLLIFVIAAKMMAGAFGFEMPHAIFFTILIALVAGTLLYSSAKRKKEIKRKA